MCHQVHQSAMPRHGHMLARAHGHMPIVPRAGLEPASGRRARRTPRWIITSVPRAGLEPARLASLVFETSASTDSATWVGCSRLAPRGAKILQKFLTDTRLQVLFPLTGLASVRLGLHKQYFKGAIRPCRRFLATLMLLDPACHIGADTHIDVLPDKTGKNVHSAFHVFDSVLGASAPACRRQVYRSCLRQAGPPPGWGARGLRREARRSCMIPARKTSDQQNSS